VAYVLRILPYRYVKSSWHITMRSLAGSFSTSWGSELALYLEPIIEKVFFGFF